MFIRFLGYFVSIVPLGLGFLWIAFDRKKRGWHDLIAGTVVVYED
ncbi:MAG: RDD family protein [Burkholderiales bacterium]